jgi:hypothetical protein
MMKMRLYEIRLPGEVWNPKGNPKGIPKDQASLSRVGQTSRVRPRRSAICRQLQTAESAENALARFGALAIVFGLIVIIFLLLISEPKTKSKSGSALRATSPDLPNG